ncbi:NADH-ubiquinone oxidoreductase-F iron-sulfur binding region domain-containing protein [Ilumatobacter nonamiensis]|uniref:NADH-ubiquinone oxidoreductase-F iron-sulfur binding region domain-containing protein n=1 Tax=Ilumatobacter nonamiensis TaxID=467093 RepID=UPI000349939A|nr:NADH-ubiquinone oxidoreductase-F iron-sulfur binding region domain-containing protein [Ilumatobacter nonamiensis]
MPRLNRILRPDAVKTLDEYLAMGGGEGLKLASDMDPLEIIAMIEASGLRGRGGAGFPTGTKWRTVAEMSTDRPVSVVVNGAEGEPGTFKDRTLLDNDPFQVIEGALITARAVGATDVVIAVKEQFDEQIARLRPAIAAFEAYGLEDVELRVVTGPSSYLYGEESALLEVVEGRPPLPRVTPPYRRGLADGADVRNEASEVALAGETSGAGSTAVVNNVETMANVTYILTHGVDEFRSVGTDATPGTAICTISGAVPHHGVAEFAMGTPFWNVLDELGGGAVDDHTVIGAISGTANAVLTADRFDTGLCFDAFADTGSGLGSAGFIVLDDHTDLAATAHGVARFLAIESCGQCQPCKDDGGAIADRLDVIRKSDRTAPADIDNELESLFGTVADGARCGLASQHQSAVASLYALACTATGSHLSGELAPAGLELIAPIVDIIDGVAQVDGRHLDKQRDWSTDGEDSTTAPVDLL